MEALTTEIMRMIDELQSMNDWQKAHPLDLNGEDSYGYKFESFNAYSTEPLSFTETAMKLHAEARKVFKMVRILNRQSPLFMQMSGHLEKLVSQLGSACITKAVMEQRGENSTVMDNMLHTLTIESLRGMTALNFRKCYDSYMESQTNYRVNPGALALSIRWSALDRRLLATKEKIELIKSGKIKVDRDDSRTNGDGFCRPGNEPEGTVPTADSDSSGVALHGQSPEQERAVTAVSTDQAAAKESKSTPLPAKGRALPIDKTAIGDDLRRGNGCRMLPNEPEETVPPVLPETTGDCLRRPDPEPEKAVTTNSAENHVPPIPSGSVTEEQIGQGRVQEKSPSDPDNDDKEENDNSCYDTEPDDLPYISDDLLRKVGEYWQDPIHNKWPLPEYVYAGSP